MIMVAAFLCRLRQCCNHLHLLTSALQGSECDERQLDLELAMGAMSLEDEHTDSARIVSFGCAVWIVVCEHRA